MKQTIRVYLLLISVALCGSSFAQTILLVRHAEKISEAPDALLSDAGQQRAEKLAHTLADSGVTAIFTTEAERTKQTAAPLARLLHLQPTVIPGKDVAGLVEALASSPEDAVILVVGHSNTLPAIIEKLLAGTGNRSAPSLAMKDMDYDKLFIVMPNPPKNLAVGGLGRPKLLILHY